MCSSASMADQIIGQLVPLCPQALDGTREIGGVPQDNGTDHQVEAGGAESLALKGAVADFAALVGSEGPFAQKRTLRTTLRG